MAESLIFDMWELLRELNLDDATKQASEKLYFKFKESESDLDPSKSLILMRCCSLIASRTTKLQTVEGSEVTAPYISISNFLKGSPSDLHTYLHYLEKLLPSISSSLSLSIKEIIRKTEISTITYNKFKDIWEKIGLKGNEGFVSNMMQMIWLLVINLKHFLSSNSIFESGYLLIATYNIALNNIDPQTINLTAPFINELCAIIKANIDQALP